MERDILIFDNRWIEKVKENEKINETDHLENHSK
jgi:hypothetical protein